MRVFLTGATGLIGQPLVRQLVRRGDQPVVLTRRAARARLEPALKGAEIVEGDPSTVGDWQARVSGCDAVINLVGHGVFDERWTPEVRHKIRDSRVYSTENVVRAIATAEAKPRVLVSASAIGYYGPTRDEELTESSPSGTDFLAVVAREWEDAARPVEALGARLAIVRVGVVLEADGGALKKLVPIFKYLPGGAAPVGGGGNPFLPALGRQWMSWIHIADIVGIFLLALDHQSATGPMNGTAPNPVRNSEFSHILARVLRRGFWPPYIPLGPPDFVLQLVLGEVAQVITTGQRVVPSRALALGYEFQFPDLEPALRNLLGDGARAMAASSR
jgi:hypothetical protein